MRGFTSNKMGGFQVPGRYYGPMHSKYRYYRIYFPNNDRLLNIPYVAAKYKALAYLYDVWLEEEPGTNLFWESDTSVSSDYFSIDSLSSWHTARKSPPSSSVLSLGRATSPHIDIDLGRKVRLSKYGLGMSMPLSGWVIYGSNNQKNWNIVNDIHPSYILETWSWELSNAKWYFIDLVTGLQPISLETEHLYWGILLGCTLEQWDIGEQAKDTVQVAEFELNDAIGGTDLLTGGSIVSGVSPNGIGISGIYIDDSTATSGYIAPGYGLCYEFTTPELPVEVTITSGYNLTRAPKWFSVIYSDDALNWFHHKSWFTTQAEWEPGSSWTLVARTL